MRIAVISDIHSNLEALTRAFEVIDQSSVDTTVCLGDIIGYGANPNECLELVKQRCSIVIKGNHEEAVESIAAVEQFSDHARTAILWTRKRLTKDNLAYIGRLPLSARTEDILFAHATPDNPSSWKYIFEEHDAKETFRCFSESLCFIGHTHMPAVFSPGGRTAAIVRGERFLVNVGSVGQPRDRNAQLSFGVFDGESWTYENVRSTYDVKAAAWKILNTDLPSKLGHRLLMGV